MKLVDCLRFSLGMMDLNEAVRKKYGLFYSFWGLSEADRDILSNHSLFAYLQLEHNINEELYGVCSLNTGILRQIEEI